MPLAKCVRCEKLFDKTGLEICAACVPDEEADYETVRGFLNENPDSNADTVSKVTGVDVLCVLRMVDGGRILNAAKAGQTRCGRCGAPAISATKKLCTKCLEALNQELLKQRNQIKTAKRKEVQIDRQSTVMETLDAKRDKK